MLAGLAQPWVFDDFSNSPAKLEVRMSSRVRHAVDELGRTEDIRFSPDNSLAALAGYANNSCLFLRTHFDRTSGQPIVCLEDFFELRSPDICEPHGFDFIGNDRIVVANRNGVISIFRIPQPPFDGKIFNVKPERTIGRIGLFHKLRSPGSVCVVQETGKNPELLACNTFHHRVSCHPLSSNRLVDRMQSHILLADGLEIPDGVAVSPDLRFIAISNHDRHCVSIFDRSVKLGPESPATGTLSGVIHPHGLRFSPNGRQLYVADAGQPLVHKFDAPDHNWAGGRMPTKSVSVLSEKVFFAGRSNAAEGGPKGIDLDATGEILAMTCEKQPLAFFSTKLLFA